MTEDTIVRERNHKFLGAREEEGKHETREKFSEDDVQRLW